MGQIHLREPRNEKVAVSEVSSRKNEHLGQPRRTQLLACEERLLEINPNSSKDKSTNLLLFRYPSARVPPGISTHLADSELRKVPACC